MIYYTDLKWMLKNCHLLSKQIWNWFRWLTVTMAIQESVFSLEFGNFLLFLQNKHINQHMHIYTKDIYYSCGFITFQEISIKKQTLSVLRINTICLILIIQSVITCYIAGSGNSKMNMKSNNKVLYSSTSSTIQNGSGPQTFFF